MKMRLAVLVVLTALLCTFLAACGDDNNTTVPTYAGATSVTLTDSLKSKMTTNLTEVKNPTIDGYKTTDDMAKIKSTYDSSFKSAGWDDKSSEFTSDTSIKQLSDAGVVVLGYQKGDKNTIIMAFPNKFAEPIGFSGLNSNENAIMVISGAKA